MDSEAANDNESLTKGLEDRKYSDTYLAPAYMAAIVRRRFLKAMVSEMPSSVQNRITVLKNLQLEHLKLEAQFFEEVYQLEKKYQEKYQPLYDKRQQIVCSEIEPEKEEPLYKVEVDEDDIEEEEKIKKDFNDQLNRLKCVSEDVKGIPDFWLTIFKNTVLLSEMVQEHDEPALRKLRDIKIRYDDKHSYTLEFHFDKNEYFSNSVLTKQYFLKSVVDEDDPFNFEGPEIHKCKGCHIKWEKTMNLTVKTIRKTQKHKNRGAVRTIVKQVPNDSFFNFFNPPEVPDDKAEIDEDSQGILATDFEVGHYIRARIIPRAILYYTGDIIDDEDDDDDEFDGEEGEEEEDDDVDEKKARGDDTSDEDDKPSKKNHPKNAQECNNQ